MVATGIFLAVAIKREWPDYAFLPFTLALWLFWFVGFRDRIRRETKRIGAIFWLGTIAMVAVVVVGILFEWPLYVIGAVVVAVGTLEQIIYRRVRR